MSGMAPRRRPPDAGRCQTRAVPDQSGESRGQQMVDNRATLQRSIEATFRGDFETAGEALAEDAVVD